MPWPRGVASAVIAPRVAPGRGVRQGVIEASIEDRWHMQIEDFHAYSARYESISRFVDRNLEFLPSRCLLVGVRLYVRVERSHCQVITTGSLPPAEEQKDS